MGMLWSFDGQGAGQYFRCWHRCIKLIWDVPLPCHNYFIDNLLADGFLPTRHKFLSRYVKFFQRLLKSSSPEVALLANIVGRDKSSTTGRNLNQISTETGMNPWCTSASSICKNLSFSKFPQSDERKIPLLKKYLSKRYQMELNLEDIQSKLLKILRKGQKVEQWFLIHF